MLQQGTYDVLEFDVPPQGMNQNISADSLPLSFAYLLENIIAKPLGEGQVRYGTSLITELPNPESTILKQFPFIKADGSKQIVLYVQEYEEDLTANTFEFIEGDVYSFSFLSPDSASRYIQDTTIKVQYTFNGITTVYDAIDSVTVLGNLVTIRLANNALPAYEFQPEPPLNPVIDAVWYSTGTLYSYDLTTGVLSAPLRQNLSVACIPRGVTFLNQLVLCNGVDKLLSYDGTTFTEIYDFVKDPVTGLTRESDTELSFTASPNFNVNNYPAGSLIELLVNGVSFQTKVVELIDQGGGDYSLEVTDVLPQFVPNKTYLFYQAFPPPFNFLYIAYDRIWALGPGAAGVSYRDPEVAMRVYFTYQPGSITQWFREDTSKVPSLDLSEKHGIPDNLEAIDLINGYMAFIGREKTQVWTGSEPGGAIASPGMPLLVYNSTLNTGIPHGDLMLDLPNDTAFVTKTGLQSVSSLNIAKQFAASSIDAVDPLVRQYVTEMTSSNITYRGSSSFKYNGGTLAGFKMGSNKVLVSLFSTTLYSWSLFSGDFLEASSFLALGDALYLAVGGKIFQYADGFDGGLPGYSDRGGSSLIRFSWTLPVIALKGRAFANKRYEVQMNYPSSWTVRPSNTMTLQVSGDLPKSYEVDSPCRFDLRGDATSTLPFTSDPNFSEESIGFRLDQPYGFIKDRLKFLASRFWLTLSGYTQDGPVSLRKIKLYGIIER